MMVAIEPAKAVVGAEIVYHVRRTFPLRGLGELHARGVRASSAPRQWYQANLPSPHRSGLPHASSRTPHEETREGSPTLGPDRSAVRYDPALRPASSTMT